MTHRPTLKSDGERNKTAAAKVAIATNAIRRPKMCAFDWGRVLDKGRRAKVNDARICASRSLNREGAGYFVRRIFEVK